MSTTTAANAPPSIWLNLDRPRQVTLDFNALTTFEDLTGRSLASGEFHNLTVADVRAFFYACLVQEDPSLTLDQVGGFFLAGHFGEALDIMLRLLLGDSNPDALAPYVPTPIEVVQAAMDLAGVGPGDRLYDLGCGDGRVLIAAGQRGAKAIGYEHNEERATLAAALTKAASLSPGHHGPPPEVRSGLIQDADLTDASVVFAYLLTNSNTKIRPMLMRDLKPGARVVTHDFPFHGWHEEATRDVDLDGRPHRLFLYRIGQQIKTGEAAANPAQE